MIFRKKRCFGCDIEIDRNVAYTVELKHKNGKSKYYLCEECHIVFDKILDARSEYDEKRST